MQHRIRIWQVYDRRTERVFAMTRRLVQKQHLLEWQHEIIVPVSVGSGTTYDNIGPQTTEAVNRILQIPGILKVIVRPYEMLIKLASPFDWTDAQAEIVQVLREVFFVENDLSVDEPADYYRPD